MRRNELITLGLNVSLPFILMIFLLLQSPDTMVNIFKSIETIKPLNGFWLVVILVGLQVAILYAGFQISKKRKFPFTLLMWVTFFACGFPAIWIILLYPGVWMLFNVPTF